MGTKNNPGNFDCYHNALPDEPMFILLARDPSAPELVEDWATERQRQIGRGFRPQSDQAMVDEAVQCAANMKHWRVINNGVWREYAAQPASPLRGRDSLETLIREYARDLRRNSSGGDDYPWEYARGTADYLEVLIGRASPPEQPAADPVTEWQDIETIPQDRPIDGWHKVWKCPVTIAYRSWGDRNAWVEKTLTTEWPIDAFTHWRETSTAPNKETQA